MKHTAILKIIFTALLLSTFVNSYAQSADVETTFKKILDKHESASGVISMTATKGNGLELMKMMFNKEFGKDFMKGVRSISFIEYSDASEDTCMALRKDIDVFMSLLREIDLSGEKQFSDNKYMRCFASISDDISISDFVIAMEDDETKMLMYMAGTIKMTF